MPYRLNEKIRGLVPYDPIQGSYAIRLDANESFFLPDDGLKAEIAEAAASAAFNRYPDPCAADLCAAFAAYYGVRPENVAAGNGSDELISVLMSSFLMKGESVVTVEPDFSMYRFYAGINEAKCIEFRKNDDFIIDTDRLIDTVNRSGSRMVIFSNPCNPTSLGLGRDEVRRLIRSVDALVVLDEAYMDFWDQSLLGEENDFGNLVILRTCSKAAGLAAIRLGFAVANPVLIRALKAVKSPYNVNSLTQKIGAAVYRNPERLRNCTQKIIESRKSLFTELKKAENEQPGQISVTDGVTNFVTVRMPDNEKAYRFLLEKSIAVRCFPGFLRITAGTEAENSAFCSSFSEFLGSERSRQI